VASPPLTAAPAGDAFQWAPDTSSTPALGVVTTVAYADITNAPLVHIAPGLTATSVTDSFNWPVTQNSAPAPDTHTAVVDTTVHDTVAPILPDPHTLAATVPSLGGYIIH
jgi:hypothetical protein